MQSNANQPITTEIDVVLADSAAARKVPAQDIESYEANTHGVVLQMKDGSTIKTINTLEAVEKMIAKTKGNSPRLVEKGT